MNKILIFVYAFITFMVIDLGIIVYLITKPEKTCAHPASEYQLTIVDDYIIVEDFGREVAQLPLDSTCNLGEILIQDNE